MEDFKVHVQKIIEEKNGFKIYSNSNITSLEEGFFKCIYNKGYGDKTRKINYDDLIEGYSLKNSGQSLSSLESASSDFNVVLGNFSKFIDEHGGIAPSLKDYVLIIDEINRANLPSVLGELIYALEYRGEAVQSMYAIDEDFSIVLPENLYIIGTMNTADRSVGHIDYAIRRRFAFVDVLPNEELIDYPKAKELFKKVSELFDEEFLAPDFKKKEVHLGHSYFLVDSDDELKSRLQYKIMPILEEYVKDGLLLENVEDKLKEIENFGT